CQHASTSRAGPVGSSSCARPSRFVLTHGVWANIWNGGLQKSDEVFLAEREAETWRKITWAETRALVYAIATSLLERGVSTERPVAILSDNSIEHALLALAAMYIGVPVAPISPAYSLMSRDFGKLTGIV